MLCLVHVQPQGLFSQGFRACISALCLSYLWLFECSSRLGKLSKQERRRSLSSLGFEKPCVCFRSLPLVALYLSEGLRPLARPARLGAGVPSQDHGGLTPRPFALPPCACSAPRNYRAHLPSACERNPKQAPDTPSPHKSTQPQVQLLSSALAFPTTPTLSRPPPPARRPPSGE